MLLLLLSMMAAVVCSGRLLMVDLCRRLSALVLLLCAKETDFR